MGLEPCCRSGAFVTSVTCNRTYAVGISVLGKKRENVFTYSEGKLHFLAVLRVGHFSFVTGKVKTQSCDSGSSGVDFKVTSADLFLPLAIVLALSCLEDSTLAILGKRSSVGFNVARNLAVGGLYDQVEEVIKDDVVHKLAVVALIVRIVDEDHVLLGCVNCKLAAHTAK